MQTEPLYNGLMTTADEYLRMPDDGFRYELIRGVLVMTPSPSFWHQRTALALAAQMDRFALERGLGYVAVAPLDVQLDSETLYQPDIVFFAGDKARKRMDSVDVIPDLVVEVASPGTARKDLQVKKDDYERAGIQEYWLVDPDARSFRFFVLRAGQYEEQPPEDYASEVLGGFRLDAADFWASLE